MKTMSCFGNGLARSRLIAMFAWLRSTRSYLEKNTYQTCRNQKMDAFMRHVQTSEKYEFKAVFRAFSEALDKRPEAASQAFAHVKPPGPEGAEMTKRRDALNAAVLLLKQHEERTANKRMWGIALAMLVAVVIAVLVIFFMR